MENPYQPPQAAVFVQNAPNPKTWKEIFFSFEGRIPRRTYWAATFIMIGIALVIALPLALIAGEDTMILVLIPLWLVAFYTGLALQAKRWHDRNKSGWWYFISLVPFIGGIWFFIEVGCLRGTIGVNNYGEDPT